MLLANAGTGAISPIEGSNPYLGQQGQLEAVEEFKVEMLCEDHLLEAAIKALRTAHPYEEPAFEYWPVHIN